MTFTRGATLATAATFGHADTSSLGPTAGNGFYKRWPDDLALLQDLGITDVRLTLDWPRLQPKPGELDRDWAERFADILTAAAAIDLRVWATAYDGGVPRWLDNEGGLDDVDATVRWWPRWVERIADRFGDLVHGWIPFAEPTGHLPPRPWADTWGILGGGSPVVATVRDDDVASVEQYLGRCDRIGIVLTSESGTPAADTANRLDEIEHRLGTVLRRVGDAAGIALVVAGATPPGDDARRDPDLGAGWVERLVAATDAAMSDGVDIGTVFVDPAIAGPDTPVALLGSDRSPGPAVPIFLPA